jgi:Holliday junction resolvase RusA-like endonuclease
MQILRIEGIPPTQNEFRRMHHFEIAKRKKEWEEIVRMEVKRQSIEKVEKVIMTYFFHFADNRKRDADNYATSCKFIQDGLVKAGILPDDDFEHVLELSIGRGWNAKKPYIEIEMVDI